MQPFGGRWYCYSIDYRWTGPYPHAGAENMDQNGGTGSTPVVDWEAKGHFFLTAGTVLKRLRCSVNVNSTEITDWYWKLYYQYPDTWDGLSNTTGEVTRVEINGGTISPTSTGYIDVDFISSEYTCPANGHLLLVGKPGGSLTANRYVQMTGYLDALHNMT